MAFIIHPDNNGDLFGAAFYRGLFFPGQLTGRGTNEKSGACR
jgi:hypothetical protein